MASPWERLYWKSPQWLQQVAVATWGVQWYRRRFGPLFHQYVTALRERDEWTSEQFHAYQTAALSGIFEAAWRSPYYRSVFAEVGVSKGMDPWNALSHMPLLEKDTLRSRPEDLLTGRAPRGTTVFQSSGSTGTPTRNYYTRGYHAFQTAVAEVRNLNLAGATYRDRRVMVGGRKVCRFDQDQPPFWRISPAERLAYLSNYHLSPRFLPAYMDFLRSFRPIVVMGYPSALEAIAQYALEHNDLPAPARCAVTVSETLSTCARSRIEAAWQCPVLDRYGAVEGCVFAGQCEFGRYHVSPDVGIVEILDADGRPCPPDTPGEIVCTGLQNTLQPLIRYRIGDVARWSSESACPCGRQTPILEGIEGRLEDFCVTPDGRRMLRFHAVFYGLPHVRQAQVIQERLDLFILRVVPAHGFGPDDVEALKANMRVHVGDVEVRVETVPEIPRSASGKFRAVVCNLPAEDREYRAGRRLAA